LLFMSVTLDFYTFEDIIHPVGTQVGSAPKYSFIVSLVSTDLN